MWKISVLALLMALAFPFQKLWICNSLNMKIV